MPERVGHGYIYVRDSIRILGLFSGLGSIWRAVGRTSEAVIGSTGR